VGRPDERDVGDLEQLDDVEFGRWRQGEECDVEASSDEVLGVPGRAALGREQPQVDVGVGGTEGAQRRGQVVDEVLPGEGAERQPPALAAGRLGRVDVQALDGVEDPPCVGEEMFAGGGQLDRLGGAAQQLDPELGLEAAQAGRDGRLRGVEAAGGLGDAQLARDRDEVLEQAGFHPASLSI
jgi:hypothetical protein